jgi:hypothetical protein
MSGLEMDPEIRARWTAALRSGEYEQGEGTLRANDKFCCLGVLCDLAAKADVISAPVEADGDAGDNPVGAWYYANRNDYLPEEVKAWAGLNSCNPVVGDSPLGNLNDGGWTFARIADAIEGAAS